MYAYLTYRKQYGLAKTYEEAVRIIEDFFNEDLDDYLHVNENLDGMLRMVFENEYSRKSSVWTTNAGYGKLVVIYPTELDDVAEIAARITEDHKVERANRIGAEAEDRKNQMKEFRKYVYGRYRVSVIIIHKEGLEGENVGEVFEDVFVAHSVQNAYLKCTDAAIAWCNAMGLTFVKARSIFSKSTKIEYLGE